MDSHIPLNPLCIYVFWFSCSLFECSFLIGFIIAALRAYEAQKTTRYAGYQYEGRVVIK